MQIVVIFGIAIERLYAMVFPVRYRIRGTPIATLCTCVGFGIIFVVLAYSASSGQVIEQCTGEPLGFAAWFQDFKNTTLLVLLGGTVLVYGVLLSLTYRKTRKVAGDGLNDELARRQKERQARMTKMVVSLVAVFLPTTGVYLIIGLIAQFVKSLSGVSSTISALLMLIDLVADVFVISLKLDEVREPMRKQLNRLCRGKVKIFADNQSGISRQTRVSAMPMS